MDELANKISQLEYTMANHQHLDFDNTKGLNFNNSFNPPFSLGGSNTNVQFNNAGVLGGTNNFTWDNVNNILKIIGNYYSQEYDNGNATGTKTINWNNSNVQYLTLTGNTTLTFTNPKSGMRVLLNVAGAFTPTFPGTVRWSTGVTPTATATAGKKDLYTFIYSGKESLYDGLQSPNYSIT